MQLRLGFNGATPGTATSVSVVAGVATLPDVAVPDFKLWSLRQGNLFTLTVRMGSGRGGGRSLSCCFV